MLSIIIPTYNEEGYLPRLLASIRSQNFDGYEIVVADAHSSDRTREIALQFGARVVDGGMPGPGRNRGAEAAKGDVLLFLDADVVLPDVDWLAGKMEQFTRRELDAATCLVKPMDGKLIDHVSHNVFNAHMMATQFMLAHAPGFCIFARKRLHERIKGFDESIKLAEDHDYVERARRIGTFRVLHGTRIRVSVRRFERDGRFSIFGKYLLAELHLLMRSQIRDDRFAYTFGHAKDVHAKDRS
ncbi:MAG: glycosyltransferase [Patescibacteria group bacterium]|nr:MAG: glycosyltransferase [Patescibacteria group bacterium]